MKNLLTGGAVAIAICLLAGGAHAQTTPSTGTVKPGAAVKQANKQDKRMAGMKRMVSELNLTPDQQEKIKTLQAKAADQIKAIRVEPKLAPDQRQAKMKAVMKETGKAIEAVLTPEQKQKLKTLREQARAARANKPGKPGKPGKA